MIVPSMTDLEILEEIKKDMPQINDYMTFVNCMSSVPVPVSLKKT